MAINVICPACTSNQSIRSKRCKRCGHQFSQRKKYRVVVRGINGKRKTKVLDSLPEAKKYESKLKSERSDHDLYGVTSVPVINDVWDKYLQWAMENKKSWEGDQSRWNYHNGLSKMWNAHFSISNLI